jgi:hypothetical protein
LDLLAAQASINNTSRPCIPSYSIRTTNRVPLPAKALRHAHHCVVAVVVVAAICAIRWTVILLKSLRKMKMFLRRIA